MGRVGGKATASAAVATRRLSAEQKGPSTSSSEEEGDPYDFDSFVSSEETRKERCLELVKKLTGGEPASKRLKQSTASNDSAPIVEVSDGGGERDGDDGSPKPGRGDSSDDDLEFLDEIDAQLASATKQEIATGGAQGAEKKPELKRKVRFAEFEERVVFQRDPTPLLDSDGEGASPQDLSEQAADVIELCDDLEFCLDGLRAGRSDSAKAKYAKKLASLVGLKGVRDVVAEQGLAEDLLDCALSLSSQRPHELRLCAALVLHCLFHGRPLTSEKEAASFLAACHRILVAPAGIEDDVGEDSRLGHAAFPRALLGCKARLTSLSATGAPAAVVLTLLASHVKTPTSQRDVSTTDLAKGVLGSSGVLGDAIRICLHVQDASSKGEQGKEEEIEQLWLMEQSLSLLCNATFLHRGNVAYLESMPRLKPSIGGNELSVPQLALSVMSRVYPFDTSLEYDCVHASLSFVLNLTHESAAPCEQIASGLFGTSVVLRILRDYYDREYAPHGPTPLLPVVEDKSLGDLANLALGLLINVAEKCKSARDKLASARLGVTGAGGDAGGDDAHFLEFLCKLSGLDKDSDADAGERCEEGAHEVEVTADMLGEARDARDKAIPQAYAAVLLGFLASGTGDARKRVCERLPGGVLVMLSEAIRSFLSFLSSAGALTDAQSGSLQDLLCALSRDD